jgi:DNA-binding CsgD family transcriptional regulator
MQMGGKMKTLETNDWVILNSIIYKIHSTENLNEMRTQFLEQMKMVLNFDSADFYLGVEDGSKKLFDPVTYNCDEDLSQVFDELDYSRGILYSGKSMVYRETDIISDEARTKTEYYRKVYRPNNWHYSLQMILAKNKHFLGVVTFYRTIGKGNFQYDDVFMLDMIKDHLTFRLNKRFEDKQTVLEKLTVTEVVEKYELTRREHTILKLLMNGMENHEICEELSISVNTLKKHILNIYRKLGIKNRVQLFKMVKEKE